MVYCIKIIIGTHMVIQRAANDWIAARELKLP